MFESGGIEYGDEACAAEARRDHDGRLVFGVVVWKQTGGILVRLLRREQSDAAREAVWRDCGRSVGRGGNPGALDTDCETTDGQS